MKFLVALAALATAASALPLHGGLVNTGASSVHRSDDGHGSYSFGFNEDHHSGGTFRKEQGGPGVQVGSYGLRDADGRVRTVNYVADIHGFRASISSNEPGVDPHQVPAATTLNGNAPVVPVAVHAEPILSHGVVPLAHGPLLDSYAPGPLLGAAHGPLIGHGPVLAGHGALLSAGHGLY